MNEEILTYIRYRLEKAQDALKTAKVIFPMTLDGTVSRLYYACFYCAIAALLLENKSTRRHATVCRLFNDTFIATGTIPREMGKFFTKMFEQRNRADYEDLVSFQESDVKKWIETTEQFVQQVSDFVKHQIKEKEIG